MVYLIYGMLIEFYFLPLEYLLFYFIIVLGISNNYSITM